MQFWVCIFPYPHELLLHTSKEHNVHFAGLQFVFMSEEINNISSKCNSTSTHTLTRITRALLFVDQQQWQAVCCAIVDECRHSMDRRIVETTRVSLDYIVHRVYSEAGLVLLNSTTTTSSSM
jgi:hypothetical protein